jgi:hypothetical protein
MSGIRLQLRHDSSANWASQNPVLKVGEAGWATDTYELRIGDGVTSWINLDPVGELNLSGVTTITGVSTPGAVLTRIDATTAGWAVLGTASAHAATDFDPAGVASAALVTAKAYTDTETIRAEGIEATKLNITDPSVTNARTPLPHAATHASGGTDPVSPASIGAATATALSAEITRALGAEATISNALATALAGMSPAEFPAATQGSGLTHSGVGQVVGGITITAGMRVLDTLSGATAGLWVAAAGAWSRPTDFATGSNAQGKLVNVDSSGGLWLCISSSPVTVDTTTQVWSEIDASVVMAGVGLAKSGNSFSVLYGTITGTAAQGNDSRITGAAQVANNLSDLANEAAARTNLGLGTAATHAATDFDPRGAAAALALVFAV